MEDKDYINLLEESLKCYIDKTMLYALRSYRRNNRWGTCVDCPESGKYPEKCKHTKRFDHQLDLEGLFDKITFDKKR